MEAHLQLSDSEFLDKIDTGSLEKSVFTHQAHLRLSYIHLSRSGILSAMINIQDQIKKYIAFLNLEDKYNTTLTIVSVKIVHQFMLQAKSDNFVDFIAEFPELQYNFKGLIEQHYGFDIFSSEQAKNNFIEPDLMGFE